MNKSISEIEAALYAAADRELEKLLEPLTKLSKDHKLHGRTKAESITVAGASGVVVPQRTWAPAIIVLAKATVEDAIRDDYRKDYVQRWLDDVNRTMSVVEELNNQ